MLRLAPRDVAVLRTLLRYRYLSSTLLHRLVGGSATTLRWRLRELFDAGLVDRPSEQWQLANALHIPAIYELGTAGRARLVELGVLTKADMPSRSARNRNFWHSALCSEMMASIEAEVTEDEELSLILEAEILERLPSSIAHPNPRALPVGDDFIIPDGLFGIRSPRGVVLYAIEVDRGGEPLTRSGPGSVYRKKFELPQPHRQTEISGPACHPGASCRPARNDR